MKTYDLIIIGSGASGGRIAKGLAGRAQNILLIEAGRHFDRHSFPKNEMLYSSQMFWNGGLEVSAEGQLGLLRGKCVGGTTVVNQALVDRFDENVFADWRNRSGVEFFNSQAMTQAYNAVEKDLEIRSIPPEHYNQNAKLFVRGFESLNYSWSPLRRAQKDCHFEKGSDCIQCLGGCPRDSKQSTLVNGIPQALKNGVELVSETEVYSLQCETEFIRVQAIHQNQKLEFSTRFVVLASSALGNFPILARSNLAEKIPALGKNFSCHPQFMAFGLFKNPIDAHKGPLQSVKSDDPKLRRSGYKFENVFAPPIGTAMLMPGFGKKHLEKMARYRFLASMEVCVRDQPNGVLKLDSRGKLHVHKPILTDDLRKAQDGLLLIKEMFHASGAEETVASPQGFGLHLMGGCGIGTDPASAVVGPDFKLFADPRISIADASVFPSAPGINPSLTVMALSELAIQKGIGSI